MLNKKKSLLKKKLPITYIFCAMYLLFWDFFSTSFTLLMFCDNYAPKLIQNKPHSKNCETFFISHSLYFYHPSFYKFLYFQLQNYFCTTLVHKSLSLEYERIGES